jgi:hypothetical protein
MPSDFGIPRLTWSLCAIPFGILRANVLYVPSIEKQQESSAISPVLLTCVVPYGTQRKRERKKKKKKKKTYDSLIIYFCRVQLEHLGTWIKSRVTRLHQRDLI